MADSASHRIRPRVRLELDEPRRRGDPGPSSTEPCRQPDRRGTSVKTAVSNHHHADPENGVGFGGIPLRRRAVVRRRIP